jgi:hypothetical protein
MDLKVHRSVLRFPPEMAMLLVEEFLCKSLVKECTESTFSSSNVILLVSVHMLEFITKIIKLAVEMMNIDIQCIKLSRNDLKFVI